MTDDDEATIFGQALPVQPRPVQTPQPAPAATQHIDHSKTIVAIPRPSPIKASFWEGLSQIGRRRHIDASSPNPLQTAAIDILGLLGRLRIGAVEIPSQPLRDRLFRDINLFTQTCLNAGLPAQDIEDGRYTLSAAADDIAMALPGADQHFWKTNTLTLEFFGDPDPFTGFFTRMNQVATVPAKRAHVLELMLTCLALGFEGRYRHHHEGGAKLIKLRAQVYKRLRSVSGRTDINMSHKWAPIVLSNQRKQALVPIWMLMGVATTMVIALFASLASVLTADAQGTQNAIIKLHHPPAPFQIKRVALVKDEPVVVYEAPVTGQVERIAEQLSADIEAGTTTLQEEGDFIAIRLGSILQFKAGLAELQTVETSLIKRIAAVLEAEPGDIIIEGHSDNIPLSGAGRYKTNEDLSKARAATVRDVLAPYLLAPTRLSVIGAGSTKPLDTANTPAARSKNRRVDILLLKEQRL